MEALIPMTLFMCVAAVLILRPITKKLGSLIELMTRDRAHSGAADSVNARTLALLDHLTRRLDQIEERLDFTERLLSARNSEVHRQFQRASAPGQDFDGAYPAG